MQRFIPLVALAVATLLAPAAALAAPTVQPSTRLFEIRALVLGDTRLEVGGKLWLDGTNLGASVGCNSIGARISVDGDVVMITGPAMMTEMACPGVSGNAETMLLRIIGLGRFTIADGKWSAEGGSIEVIESPAPDPNAVPPDQGSNPNGVVCSTTIDPAPGAGGGAPVPAPFATDLPCAAVNGVGVDVGRAAPGAAGSSATPLVDTARDILFVPLAIAFGILLLVTAGLLLRGRPTPR